MMPFPRIVVAGASGYIGRALVPKLLQKFPSAQIIALSRSQQKSDDPRVTWKSCDLFSLKSIEEALPDQIDVAIYLVHSMGPTAQLDQGNFADYDLLLADNFARVSKKAKAQQVIYLGGLIPESKELSLHLQSRFEVEQIFNQYQLPTTVFRAGLILGSEGSSFQILLKLVKRLPIMICPRWTQTPTTPVDLELVLSAICQSVLDKVRMGKVYDLAGCRPLSYVQMMQETAKSLGLRRHFITVPFFTPTLSRLWVRLITNTSKDLVYPLIESLEHPMVARQSHLFSEDFNHKTYSDLLGNSLFANRPSGKFFHFRVQRKTVRSVQRFAMPQSKDAIWIQNEYFHWISRCLSPFVKFTQDDDLYALRLFGASLLTFQLDSGRSSQERQLFNIVGGLLVSKNNKGRLEFRSVLSNRIVLVAIHDYKPSLPWFVYKFSQAWAHLFVMRSFDRHLGVMASKIF